MIVIQGTGILLQNTCKFYLAKFPHFVGFLLTLQSTFNTKGCLIIVDRKLIKKWKKKGHRNVFVTLMSQVLHCVHWPRKKKRKRLVNVLKRRQSNSTPPQPFSNRKYKWKPCTMVFWYKFYGFLLKNNQSWQVFQMTWTILFWA